MDEYGEGIYPDLRFYYGVDLIDVIEGRGPAPSLVNLMVQRLPDDSMTAALAAGSREHFGWGMDRHLLAAIYDAQNFTTRATGNFKKAPDIPLWPRPGDKKSKSKKDSPKKKVSVADIYRKYTSKR